MNTEFVEFHKPCPVCDSSDACSVNEDGSAKCFSCDTFIQDYYKQTGEEKGMEATVTKLKDNKHYALEVPRNGVFSKIDHRNISGHNKQNRRGICSANKSKALLC